MARTDEQTATINKIHDLLMGDHDPHERQFILDEVSRWLQAHGPTPRPPKAA